MFDPVDEEEAKKRLEDKAEQKKPKPEFEFTNLSVLTSDDAPIKTAIKPGHWVTITQRLRANKFDFAARLESAVTDRNGQPHPLEHTPFAMRMSGPALLPKGQTKQFDTNIFIPRRSSIENNPYLLESRLLARRGSREVNRKIQPTVAMPGYQYYFIVLAREPDRYGFIKSLHSVAPPTELTLEQSIQYYRVVMPRFTRRVPVPSHPLTWTSVAYVVWDDLDPNLLSPDQQQAMLDWIHWGGQLIISGPRSLGALQRSFLTNYLPADGGNSIGLEQSAFDALNEKFSLQQKKGERELLTVPAGRPIVAIQLDKRPEAQFVDGTGGLVVERRVGRGRIVATSFSLDERSVGNWGNFDGFFNCCLLRRPARHFYTNNNGMISVRWNKHRTYFQDALFTTSLRYFSRDIGETAGLSSLRHAQREANTDTLEERRELVLAAARENRNKENRRKREEHWRLAGYRSIADSGVAGWSDFSGAANAARESLREAAGISVPKAEFVIRVLAIYIVVLVPLNWLFFRLIGRVEWAWVAAPIIAIIGGLAVVRFAQLDIGFARSRTEIGILETHGGYSRAHLTRYCALYTSLSSNYSLAFDDTTALAQPFSTDPNYTRLIHQGLTEVRFERGRDVRLTNLPVSSNSTGMVHAEQMLNLGGGIAMQKDDSGGLRLINQGEITIRDAGVVRRTAAGVLERAWVGELEPGETWKLEFEPAESPHFEQWRRSPILSRQQSTRGEISLWRMLDLAVDQLRILPEEVRLIGWTDQNFPGLTISPAASQNTVRTLILVHLRQGALPPITPDVNNIKEMIALGGRDPLTDSDFFEVPLLDTTPPAKQP